MNLCPSVNLRVTKRRASSIFHFPPIAIGISIFNYPVLTGALLFALSTAFAQTHVGTPIPLGHSHNDYLQKRPLWEALENGFTSIEIDVYAVNDGSLRVSHLPFSLKAKPRLQDLYLAPLQQWIANNNGRVFPDSALPLTLMIDLKGDGNAIYPLLKETFRPYRTLLTRYRNDSILPGPLRVMLSGNRPVSLLAADTEQWFSLDAPLGSDYTGQHVQVSRESAPFAAWFAKRGNGTFTPAERENLQNFVKRCTANGRELRFWAAGNDPDRWEALADAGVSVLNADKLSLFRRWVTDYTAQKKQAR